MRELNIADNIDIPAAGNASSDSDDNHNLFLLRGDSIRPMSDDVPGVDMSEKYSAFLFSTPSM